MKDLRSFLGMASYLRKYLKNLAQISAPLYELTGGKKIKTNNNTYKNLAGNTRLTNWNQNQMLISNDVLLAFPDYNKPMFVFTDASSRGLGAVLFKSDDTKHKKSDFKIFSYASLTLSKYKKNHSAFRLEFLAIFWGLTIIFYNLVYQK